MKNFIYADNAATTKLDEDVFEAMRPYLLEEFGNASQPYSFSRNPKKAIRQAREIIASCIGASPEEIFFTSGGTESDNWVIKGISSFSGKNRAIITSNIEHHAILNACQSIEKLGYPVTYLPASQIGEITPNILKSVITQNTGLVSVIFANNEIGTIQPIKQLASITHNNGAAFHTDAVQAIGHLKIDVEKLDIDLLSASAHKFNGPKGIGFLYIKNGIKIMNLLDGGSQEFGYRAGTENTASIVGMAFALQKNLSFLDVIQSNLKSCEKEFLTVLKSNNIDFILNGSDNHLPGLVNISIKSTSGEMLLHRLDLLGYCISTGSACDSKETKISHVIQAIKVPDEYAKGTIRISFGKNNKIDDATLLAKSLCRIIKEP